MSNVIRFTIPGAPRGKGRHRSVPLMRGGRPVFDKSGRPIMRQYPDPKTVEYEAQIKAIAEKAMVGKQMLTGAIAMKVDMYFAIPKSWSKAKREAALAALIRPTVKPDKDNIEKVICDAINKIVYIDDAAVTDSLPRKRYAEVPRVEVTAWKVAEGSR